MGKACNRFKNASKHWVRHSDNENLSLRDEANVELFKKERVKLLSGKLQRYASKYLVVRHQH